ncbi:glycerophosphodiester phosphodiesterase family protein [Arthrobacter sp. LAPM80]|uniref:glycerophosphodiester phosphodiesterase n=1 Tax=Arthrobacter sp. LAPM80 TaxID=3141788 RepID=UPI00398B2591
MRIYAHRGVSAHLPENTLPAFSRASELGVDGIELDVHLSADLLPMVIHDDTADRTTNGRGSITEFTSSQLGRLDAGDGQGVPTLAQVLELAAGKLRVNIELKDAASADAVAAAAAAVPGLDWFASSANWLALARLRHIRPEAMIYPLCVGRLEKLGAMLAGDGIQEQFTGRGLMAAIDFALAHGAEGLSIWENGLDAVDVAAIHSAGLQAWAWTVNDPARARELAAIGVDALCTDDPELIQRAVAGAAPATLETVAGDA